MTTKVHIATYETDDDETAIVGAFRTEAAAVEALVVELEILWDGDPRPKSLDDLRRYSDRGVDVVETVLR